jgi:hypothetical protein
MQSGRALQWPAQGGISPPTSAGPISIAQLGEVSGRTQALRHHRAGCAGRSLDGFDRIIVSIARQGLIFA